MTTTHTGSPPGNDAAPAFARATAISPHADTAESSQYRRQDGFAAPTADERYEFWILAEAQRLGYRLSCKCLDCSRPLTDKISVRCHRGPVCRRRAGVVI